MTDFHEPGHAPLDRLASRKHVAPVLLQSQIRRRRRAAHIRRTVWLSCRIRHEEVRVKAGSGSAIAHTCIHRLRRVCAAVGNNSVQFISCSATIANPKEVRQSANGNRWLQGRH